MDNARFEAELDRDRRKWKTRRLIAIWSFVSNIVIAAFYMIAPIVITSDQAQILSQFNSIVIAIVGLFSSICMVYIGAATYADKFSGVDVTVSK